MTTDSDRQAIAKMIEDLPAHDKARVDYYRRALHDFLKRGGKWATVALAVVAQEKADEGG